MAAICSVLHLRCPPGRLDEALAQFEAARVLETCREAVPGFINGRLLRSLDDDATACVICEWESREAFEQWQASPRRRVDIPERLFEPSGRSAVYAQVREVHR